MFTPRVLSALRDQNEKSLDLLATLEQVTVNNGLEVLVPVATGVPCRIAPDNLNLSSEPIQGDRKVAKLRWLVVFGWEQAVEPNYRITVTDKAGTWSKVLDVIAPPVPRSNQVLTKVVCEENR